jgi:hypothetical protein
MNTTLIRFLSVSVASLVATVSVWAQAPKVEFPRPSPTATLKQRVGLTDIEITYSRPGVKGRQVYGQLLPYGVVWRTGANEATRVKFSTPVKFGGVDVPAGEYALFSIPGASEWTFILNKATGDWGAYKYDEKNDIARIPATAVKLTEPVESFTIDLNDLHDESAVLNLIWQNTRVPVKIQFETVAGVVKQIEAAMAGDPKPVAGLYDNAAMLYLNNGLDLKKAAEWEATVIQTKPSFSSYYHQALILAKMGDKEGAIASARKSLELVNGSAKDEYTRLNNMLISSLGQ